MRVRITHVTRYGYETPVVLGPHTIRLVPAPRIADQVVTYDLAISPQPHTQWQHDHWGDRLVRATWVEDETHEALEIRVDLVVDLRPVNPFDFYLDDRCARLPFQYPDGLGEELAPFVSSGAPDPSVAAWLADFDGTGPVVDVLVRLNQRVGRDVGYVIRNEPGIQTPAETLTVRRGSCRDSAWLLVEAARQLGLAARFVSGYLVQLEDEGDIPGLPRGMSRDVVDLHAWCEVFVPGGGWIGLDGTSGLLAGEGHLPLAAAVVPHLAAPLTGTASGRATEFHFEMSVERLGHEPRPRKPYTDEQWEGLLAAGDDVDDALRRRGVNMTVGGEPTWTTREEPARAEWNTEALGEGKWRQAQRFARGIAERFGAQPVVLQRFGKHYPGESLPRWALDIVWRADGAPMWRDPTLLVQWDAQGGDDDPLARPSDEELDLAHELCAAITSALGVAAEPIAVYEDPWVVIQTEAELPVDVDPREWRVEDDEERRRLARTLSRGPERPTAFVVPVQAQQGRWFTAPWATRRGRVYLVPGDSPAGLRLPLSQLAGEAWYEPLRDPSTMSPSEPLVTFQSRETSPASVPADGVAYTGPALSLRTALAVEIRDGVACVFVPPTGSLEAFCSFVEAAEHAAAELGVAVRLEGYPPPYDPRIQRVTVTPDPGVIEVNIPPTASTREHADVLARLQEAARHAGLWCEKFLLDGRAVGTGGGNHITLGGPVPSESPFLRRPELLAGLLRFFQRHPSLSYLFNGLFVGPTSQAPRLDEGRMDSLAELELALRQLERAVAPPPWAVDRALRDLLTDAAGNTHRSEICVDKLFSPDGPAGRLGIVELRAFEMPPHERMAVAQAILVRAIVAAVAECPDRTPLVRWGTRLHDEFMLPHFLWTDLLDVLDTLDRAGVPLDPMWFRPFLDTRFPLLGDLTVDGVTLEVRPALEPWPVLGEEPAGGGVSRYVDSSLERIEVRLCGGVPGRHGLAVNGVAIDLHATDAPSVWVTGVRFRAWQPPRCLQPHIGTHHPLRLDIVDYARGRSLAGCMVHVWHAEGRAFTEPPLTAFEAAARRASRFTRDNHWVGPVPTRSLPRHPDLRYTADLRWLNTDALG